MQVTAQLLSGAQPPAAADWVRHPIRRSTRHSGFRFVAVLAGDGEVVAALCKREGYDVAD
jgi:hypothetical protein